MPDHQSIYTLKIGGQAGQGIKSAGKTFARFASRSGYNVFTHVEYPSIIRGGHNVMQINVGTGHVTAAQDKTDFLIALNQDTIHQHAAQINAQSSILYDGEDQYDLSIVDQQAQKYALPLSQLAKEAGGKDLLINTVALGAVVGLCGGDLEVMLDLIKDEYGDKGAEILAADQKAATLGYNYMTEHFKTDLNQNLKPIPQARPAPHLVVNGNEAAALGAIAAGVQYVAIYPMSPISNILHVLTAHKEKYGYIYKQPEDEIAAISMAIGAAHAGARAMTATSGGGFCLMAESYGLAGMAEIPLVIIEGMRGSPGTGVPTWSEQGDLRLALHAHQGDFPRIVLTPGDPAETFHMTMQAFNLAEKYQTTVVVLIDKNVCECDQNFPFFDIDDYAVDRGQFTMETVDDYQRYAHAADGISLRSTPGSGNFFIANSDEHDPYGYSTEEIAERNAQMEKRMQKLTTCAKEDMESPVLYGPDDADLTLISWGSNKGAILQAIAEYPNVNYLHNVWINPLPVDEISTVLDKAKKVVGIESNISGQFMGWIREKTGYHIDDQLLKYDGRPFYPSEIKARIESTLKVKGGKSR